MPHIRAFHGLTYNPEKIKDFARVVTEPYDVISHTQQDAYHKAHPYNIIRLILGKRYPRDNKQNNCYTRAKKFFSDWQKQKILLRDKQESIYIYTQTFPHNNKRRTRTGFIVLLKLEDFAKNTILPHENTHSQAVEDRLKLLKTVRANLSPIFALFSDPQGEINKILSRQKRSSRPYIVAEQDNVLHQLWRMSDKNEIGRVKRLLQDKQIFIADGHHRYEAALNYKMLQAEKGQANNSAPFNYVMTYLIATADPGLTILSTHRVLKGIAGLRPERVIQDLKKFFKLRRFSTAKQTFAYMRDNKDGRIFGAYLGKNKFCGLKLKHIKDVYKFMDKSMLRRDLDVNILHSIIIEHILKLNSSHENIIYTRDAQEAIGLVDRGKYQMALFLKPATVAQLKRVAQRGERMPHKTTYFYPKLLTGLVINAF